MDGNISIISINYVAGVKLIQERGEGEEHAAVTQGDRGSHAVVDA